MTPGATSTTATDASILANFKNMMRIFVQIKTEVSLWQGDQAMDQTTDQRHVRVILVLERCFVSLSQWQKPLGICNGIILWLRL